MIYVSNAFSLNMLNDDNILVNVKATTKEVVQNILKNNYFESYVGHPTTAEFLSKILEIDIKYNRGELKLTENDILFVFQLQKRLPEGIILSKEEIEKIPYKIFILKIIKL